MVAVGMRDDDMRDGAAVRRRHDRGKVPGVGGSRIDHRQLALTDEISVRSFER